MVYSARTSRRARRRRPQRPASILSLDLLRHGLGDVVVDLQRVAPGHQLAEPQPLGRPRRLGIYHRAHAAVAGGGALHHAIAVVVHLEKLAVVAPALDELRGSRVRGRKRGGRHTVSACVAACGGGCAARLEIARHFSREEISRRLARVLEPRAGNRVPARTSSPAYTGSTPWCVSRTPGGVPRRCPTRTPSCRRAELCALIAGFL